jgi:SNF2 family DNA or RNA helicase
MMLWYLWGIREDLDKIMKKIADKLIKKLGSKDIAITFCELKTHQKDILNNEIKYWNKIRRYIYECY